MVPVKHLRLILSLLPLALLPAVHAENVGDCFRVREMVKTEEIRYLVDAVSHCGREYEAVYVLVSFLDHAGRHLDDGVWAIYWCRPGRREIHEFAIPAGALGFARVVLNRITVDAGEALRGKAAVPSGPSRGNIRDPGAPPPAPIERPSSR
jgi:hypothetical protein